MGTMKEEIIFINDLRINCRIMGEGKPILVLHGWGSNSERWQKVGELLVKKEFKVVIPDLPGFGKSQEPLYSWGLNDYCGFIEKLVLTLKLEKFYLLGHSFGGAVAVKYSFQFPQKVEKLFLVSPACLRKKSLKKRLFFILSKILKIFSFLPFYQKIRKGLYKFIIRKSDYLYAKGMMKDIYLKIIKEDLSDILPFIKISTIIIWGEKDKIKPLKEAYLIKKKIKNSKLEIIPNVGHNPHRESPEKLSEIIIQFIKS